MVGRIVHVNENATRIMFSVHDGTGVVEMVMHVQDDDELVRSGWLPLALAIGVVQAASQSRCSSPSTGGAVESGRSTCARFLVLFARCSLVAQFQARKRELVVNTYVRAYGALRRSGHQLGMTAYNMRPLQDFNEVRRTL